MVGVISNRKRKFKPVDLLGVLLTKFPSFVEHPDPTMRETLGRVLLLLNVMTLKRVTESVFFEINIFTACNFKYKKEATNSLMAFNLLKIIHPF